MSARAGIRSPPHLPNLSRNQSRHDRFPEPGGGGGVPQPMRSQGAACRSRAGTVLSLAFAAFVTGCAEPQGRVDPFTATGELVALSGGDAGARSACITCHGLRGQGDGQTAPWLAGLPRGYLQKQLEDYASGLREDDIMRPIAKALNHRDRAAVAAYYAAMAAPSGVPPSPEAAALGERLYHHGDAARGLAACASCHGAAAQGDGPANPPLAGQPSAYLEAQLRLWRQGRRRNDPLGRMQQISELLSPSEAAALASYVAALAPAAAPADRAPEASPS